LVLDYTVACMHLLLLLSLQLLLSLYLVVCLQELLLVLLLVLVYFISVVVDKIEMRELFFRIRSLSNNSLLYFHPILHISFLWLE
jgi:hypothetical protein